MNYDSQRIQPKRWTIEKHEKDGIFKAEHGEGKARKNAKEYSHYECMYCGKLKKWESNRVNRFCTSWCSQLFSMAKWFNCSICLAKVGIGSKTAARLLMKSPSNITMIWRKKGIVAARPENKSWFVIAQKEKTKEKRLYDKYEKAWVSEMNQDNKAFIDWSYVWIKEQLNKAAMLKYNSPESLYERACYRDIISHNYKSIYPDWSRLWYNSRMRMTSAMKIKDNLRTRLKALIKTAKKGGHSVSSLMIGCNTNQLAKHLEGQFTKGMTWDNYGTHWHVDHILPVSSFDHTNKEQIKRCWHWTNLRPLEAKANIIKSDKITEPQMNLMLCYTH